MKLTTLDINNVNKRLPHLLAWLKTARPDILCLQENKHFVMAGVGPSKTGVNALMPGHPRLTSTDFRRKTWMPGTSPGMNELFECLVRQRKKGDRRVQAAAPDLI
jgi:hypothetical protein